MGDGEPGRCSRTDGSRQAVRGMVGEGGESPDVTLTGARPTASTESVTASMRRTTLCITTFRRPVGLAEALASVEQLRVPSHIDLSVVVVDNDPDGSARPVVEQAASRGMRVRYVLEPTRGLSHVRNRSWAETADAEWVIFLDDDEAPNVDWLERIDDVQRATDADVTVGPSVPVFERRPPAWVEEGGFFERERFPNGSAMPYWYARTSGVLVRRAATASLGHAPFDPYLALVGGEDLNFFAQLDAAGATFAWADDAVVRERVPATRATAAWLIRRAFRTGNSRSMTLLRVERATARRRLKRVAAGVVTLLRGVLALVVARTAVGRVRALQTAATGAGLALGALGYRYAEYKTTHGN